MDALRIDWGEPDGEHALDSVDNLEVDPESANFMGPATMQTMSYGSLVVQVGD